MRLRGSRRYADRPTPAAPHAHAPATVGVSARSPPSKTKGPTAPSPAPSAPGSSSAPRRVRHSQAPAIAPPRRAGTTSAPTTARQRSHPPSRPARAADPPTGSSLSRPPRPRQSPRIPATCAARTASRFVPESTAKRLAERQRPRDEIDQDCIPGSKRRQARPQRLCKRPMVAGRSSVSLSRYASASGELDTASRRQGRAKAATLASPEWLAPSSLGRSRNVTTGAKPCAPPPSGKRSGSTATTGADTLPAKALSVSRRSKRLRSLAPESVPLALGKAQHIPGSTATSPAPAPVAGCAAPAVIAQPAFGSGKRRFFGDRAGRSRASCRSVAASTLRERTLASA